MLHALDVAGLYLAALHYAQASGSHGAMGGGAGAWEGLVLQIWVLLMEKKPGTRASVKIRYWDLFRARRGATNHITQDCA